MRGINYAFGYGHLSGATSGYRLMRDMKKKGLNLKDFDLECTLRNLLDEVIDDIKKEVEDAAHEQYQTYGA